MASAAFKYMYVPLPEATTFALHSVWFLSYDWYTQVRDGSGSSGGRITVLLRGGKLTS